MVRVTVVFSGHSHADVWSHLHSNQNGEEEAAFLFADVETVARCVTFHVRDWYRVAPSDFEARGIHGLELTDDCRTSLIKRAHDEQRSLIECHSHPGPRLAAFSPFDVNAFAEFVPHIRWRLKKRPYAAIVVADTSFDAVAWIDNDVLAPREVSAVTAGDQIFYPTGKTIRAWREVGRGYTIRS